MAERIRDNSKTIVHSSSSGQKRRATSEEITPKVWPFCLDNNRENGRVIPAEYHFLKDYCWRNESDRQRY